jgi:hypothetical protein
MMRKMCRAEAVAPRARMDLIGHFVPFRCQLRDVGKMPLPNRMEKRLRRELPWRQ